MTTTCTTGGGGNWPLPLENNTIKKEVLEESKNQTQVGQVNAFKSQHTKDGLLLQARKKDLVLALLYHRDF